MFFLWKMVVIVILIIKIGWILSIRNLDILVSCRTQIWLPSFHSFLPGTPINKQVGKLKCVIECDPLCSVVWFRNDTPISPDGVSIMDRMTSNETGVSDLHYIIRNYVRLGNTLHNNNGTHWTEMKPNTSFLDLWIWRRRSSNTSNPRWSWISTAGPTVWYPLATLRITRASRARRQQDQGWRAPHNSKFISHLETSLCHPSKSIQ